MKDSQDPRSTARDGVFMSPRLGVFPPSEGKHNVSVALI